jgi:hypothetical protein
VGDGDRIHPERLHAGPLEHLPSSPVGELPQARGGRPREPLELRRELLPQLGLHVHVGIELVDQRGGDLVADLLVGDQVVRGVPDGLRVEPLEADVRREQAHDREESTDDDQDACDCDSHKRFISGRAPEEITPTG